MSPKIKAFVDKNILPYHHSTDLNFHIEFRSREMIHTIRLSARTLQKVSRTPWPELLARIEFDNTLEHSPRLLEKIRERIQEVQGTRFHDSTFKITRVEPEFVSLIGFNQNPAFVLITNDLIARIEGFNTSISPHYQLVSTVFERLPYADQRYISYRLYHLKPDQKPMEDELSSWSTPITPDEPEEKPCTIVTYSYNSRRTALFTPYDYNALWRATPGRIMLTGRQRAG